MENLRVFIPKLHESLSESLPPVGFLHGKKIQDMGFNNLSKGSFMGI